MRMTKKKCILRKREHDLYSFNLLMSRNDSKQNPGLFYKEKKHHHISGLIWSPANSAVSKKIKTYIRSQNMFNLLTTSPQWDITWGWWENCSSRLGVKESKHFWSSERTWQLTVTDLCISLPDSEIAFPEGNLCAAKRKRKRRNMEALHLSLKINSVRVLLSGEPRCHLNINTSGFIFHEQYITFKMTWRRKWHL